MSTVLFAALAPPPVLARRRLVVALAVVAGVVLAVVILLLRRRLELGSPSSGDPKLWLLAIASSTMAAKALARAGVTERVRRLRRA